MCQIWAWPISMPSFGRRSGRMCDVRQLLLDCRKVVGIASAFNVQRVLSADLQLSKFMNSGDVR